MEEGEGEGLESAIIMEEATDKKKVNVPDAPPLVGPRLPGADNIQVVDLTNQSSVDTTSQTPKQS